MTPSAAGQRYLLLWFVVQWSATGLQCAGTKPELLHTSPAPTQQAGSEVGSSCCMDPLAWPAERRVDPFGLVELVELWPITLASAFRPRPWPLGPAYNTSLFTGFINITYVTLLTELSTSGLALGIAESMQHEIRRHSKVLYPMGVLWSLTYSYQLNQPPPLGSPECQFPEITRPGVCANMVAYIPAPANATMDNISSVVSDWELPAKLADAWNKEGVPVTMPPDYIKCEVIEGAIAPIGRFRSPLQTLTNASTLHLLGPGLSSFADWQVEATKGALWGAYAEIALYMDILRVEINAPLPRKEKELDKGSVTLTFSYDFFDFLALDSDFERYRPVLTKQFFDSLHSRGVDVDAVCIEPAAPVALEGAPPPPRTAADFAGTAAAVLVSLACGALLYGRRPPPGRQPSKARDPAQDPSPGQEPQLPSPHPTPEPAAGLQRGRSGGSAEASPQGSTSAGRRDDGGGSATGRSVPPPVQRAGPVQPYLGGQGAAASAFAQELPPGRQGSNPRPSPPGEQAAPGLAQSGLPSLAVHGSNLLPRGEQAEPGLAHSAAPPQQDGLGADGQALDALGHPSSQARALATSTSSLHGARTPDVACGQLVGSRSPASLEAPNSSSGSALQEALATPDPAPREPPSARAEDSRGSADAGAAGGSGGAGAERAPAVGAGAPGRGGAVAAQGPLRTPYVDLCELPWAGEEAERVRGSSAAAPDTVQEPPESAADAAARREMVARLAERRSSSMGLAERGAECARPQLSRKSRSLGAARGPNPFAEIRDRIARPRCAGTA